MRQFIVYTVLQDRLWRPIDRSLATTLAALVPLTIACASASDIAALAFHLECDSRTPESQRLLLPYWSKPIAKGDREPVCVLRQPALSGLELKSTWIESATYGSGSIAWIELTADARTGIERMTRDNVGRRVALVVREHVVAIPTIIQPFSDTKFPVHAASRAESESILEAVGLKPSTTVLSAEEEMQINRDFRELQGTWLVVRATRNGALTNGGNLGEAWTFQGNKLTVTTPDQKYRQHYILRIDADAQPKAFYATAQNTPRQDPGWMIFSRDGDRLRIGGLRDKARPESFAPRDGLSVATLLPGNKAERLWQEHELKGKKLCPILFASGIEDLLGSHIETARQKDRNFGPVCQLVGLPGRITVLVVPELDKASLEQERLNFLRDARNTVSDEPELGSRAFAVTSTFSATSAPTRTYVARKGETLIMIFIDTANPIPDRSRAFAKRLLMKL